MEWVGRVANWKKIVFVATNQLQHFVPVSLASSNTALMFIVHFTLLAVPFLVFLVESQKLVGGAVGEFMVRLKCRLVFAWFRFKVEAQRNVCC